MGGHLLRGDDPPQNALFSYISPERRVPQDHPRRRWRPKVDAVGKNLWRRFDQFAAPGGRPSIAPEKWLRARRWPVLYRVRVVSLARADYVVCGENRLT